MAASVNRVILIGNVGQDPDARHMTNGDAVTGFTLATSESWKDKNTGEKKDATEWHRIVLFRKLGEIAAQYVRKGSQLYIEGALKTRKWTDKEGVDRYTTEIVASEMRLLGSKPESEERARVAKPVAQSAGGSGGSFNEFEDDIPFLFNMNTVCDTLGKPLSLWRAKYGKELSLVRANKTNF